MSIIDTSLTVVRYVEESTPGTTPASALKEMRFTGESLTEGIATAVSNEIRDDRQITDNILLSKEPSGGVDFELSYAMLDDLLEGALFSDWGTATNVSGTDIAAVASGNKYTATVTDFTAQNLSVGKWIKVAGFATAANNGWCKVVSFDATNLTVSGLTLVNESASPTITMKGTMLRNGVTKKSYSLEKEFTSNKFMYFLGMHVSNLSMSLASNSIVTGNISFMGMSSGTGTSTIGTGAPTSAPTNDVVNTSSNIGQVREDGTLISSSNVYLTGLDLTVDNGLRGQKAIENLGNVGVGAGRCNVSGTLTAFFSDFTMYNKFVNQTATSLDFKIEDAAGNAYMITLPHVKFTTGELLIGGIDADIELPLGFQALRDTTTDCTIQIVKVDA